MFFVVWRKKVTPLLKKMSDVKCYRKDLSFKRNTKKTRVRDIDPDFLYVKQQKQK